MQTIYLDYAAATPLCDEALAAMRPFWQERWQNPSALYQSGRAAKEALESARATVAHWLGAKPGEIVFTAGATEANNLAIHGVMRQHPDGEALVSAIEHESVLRPAAHYRRQLLQPRPDGIIVPDELRAKLTDHTVLVSVMYANNETGTIQPLAKLAEVIGAERKRRGPDGLPLYFHTDAAQAGNYLDLHAKRLGVDLMSLNGGKVYGPKQSGALFVRGGVKLEPLIDGGGQERGLRSGTEHVAAAAGFAAALAAAQTARQEESVRVAALRDQLQDALIKLGAAVNGSQRHRLPNNLNVSFEGTDGEAALMLLDEAGLEVATGSACSANRDEPSHVLEALGLDDQAISGSLRLTLGRPTTKAEVAQVAKLVAATVSRLRS